jgi:hypothetical protein
MMLVRVHPKPTASRSDWQRRRISRVADCEAVTVGNETPVPSRWESDTRRVSPDYVRLALADDHQRHDYIIGNSRFDQQDHARLRLVTLSCWHPEGDRAPIQRGRIRVLRRESWFLGQCARLAAATGVRGLVMFSDPVERRRADGTVIMPGHVGVIYQASNAVYTGRATARTLALLPDGTVFSDRAAQKIRTGERGHDYAERRLVALGARPRRPGENPAAWLAEALPAARARKIRHPGNHRYAFRLGTTRRARANVTITPRPGPYPKKALGQLDLFSVVTDR